MKEKDFEWTQVALEAKKQLKSQKIKVIGKSGKATYRHPKLEELRFITHTPKETEKKKPKEERFANLPFSIDRKKLLEKFEQQLKKMQSMLSEKELWLIVKRTDSKGDTYDFSSNPAQKTMSYIELKKAAKNIHTRCTIGMKNYHSTSICEWTDQRMIPIVTYTVR